MQASLLKSVGYLISTASVILLGIVAWASVRDNEALRLALLLGAAASIAGMVLRWLSYQLDEKQDAGVTASARQPLAHPRSSSERPRRA